MNMLDRLEQIINQLQGIHNPKDADTCSLYFEARALLDAVRTKNEEIAQIVQGLGKPQ